MQSPSYPPRHRGFPHPGPPLSAWELKRYAPAFLSQLCPHLDDDGCLCWLGKLGRGGHGLFDMDGRSIGAHRFAYQFVGCALPDTLVLHHVCENPRCVNPEHLQALTPSQHAKVHLRGRYRGRR